jgi:hypothetical protein
MLKILIKTQISPKKASASTIQAIQKNTASHANAYRPPPISCRVFELNFQAKKTPYPAKA